MIPLVSSEVTIIVKDQTLVLQTQRGKYNIQDCQKSALLLQCTSKRIYLCGHTFIMRYCGINSVKLDCAVVILVLFIELLYIL